MREIERQAGARNAIKGAFAGDENAERDVDSGHSTNVKSRKTEKSKLRTPEV